VTIVAVWLNGASTGQQFIECIADSRVTEEDNNHTISQLLNISAKILSIPIVARCPGPSGSYDIRHHIHSFGLAFSGSSLIGLNLSSTISSLTSQLVGRNKTAIPSFQDIADLAVRITRHYVQDYGNAYGKVPLFQAAIFGWCPVNQTYQLTTFGRSNGHSASVFVKPFDLNTPDSVFLMGDHIEEIQNEIVIHRHNFLASMARDMGPRTIIARIIRARTYLSIGGALQDGRGSSNGFYLCPSVQAVVCGEQVTDEVSFRGLDLYDDIGKIGPCNAHMCDLLAF
jgi:hypothetical protein